MAHLIQSDKLISDVTYKIEFNKKLICSEIHWVPGRIMV